jgi:molecular chaperone DnaK
MRIMPSSGLTDNEIDGMVKDAERFAQEDRKHKEEVELRNRADSTAYGAEKLLREQGDKVPDNVKSDIEAKISALRSASQGQSLDDIRAKLSDLEMALQQMGAAMYEQPGATPPPGDQGPPPDDKDVVEGEFTEA